LTIKGEKREEKHNSLYHAREVILSSFSRSWSIPEHVNLDEDPELKLENGLLSITFSKKTDTKVKNKKKYLTF